MFLGTCRYSAEIVQGVHENCTQILVSFSVKVSWEFSLWFNNDWSVYWCSCANCDFCRIMQVSACLSWFCRAASSCLAVFTHESSYCF